jgi:hypothetical protein
MKHYYCIILLFILVSCGNPCIYCPVSGNEYIQECCTYIPIIQPPDPPTPARNLPYVQFPDPPTPATTTMTASVLGSRVDNPCIICPDSITDGIDDVTLYADNGDFSTCMDLIDEAKRYECGTIDCGYAEFDEFQCCYSELVNLCIICPDVITASLGDDYVPENEGNSSSCKTLITSVINFESGSDACALYNIDVAYCCPPEAKETPIPVNDTIPSTSKLPTSSTGEPPPDLSSRGRSVPGIVGLMLSIISTYASLFSFRHFIL